MTTTVTTPAMPPHEAARRALGATAPPERLAGGGGLAWRCGDVVLKPAADPGGTPWLSEILAAVPEDGFRLARPVRTDDGRWAVDGWTATRWLAGETGPVGHWPELLAAARAFHRALAGVARPAGLDARDDRWARADRAAWGESAPPVSPALAVVAARLRALARTAAPSSPAPGRAQLVHGDLSGNVLLSPGLPPAVIDVSPYWRPAAYAEAVAVADGLLWWGEGDALLDAAGRAGDPVLVARGLLFRLHDLDEHRRTDGSPVDAAARAPYERAAGVLEERLVRRLRRPRPS